MLIIVVSIKDKLDIYVLTYNDVYHVKEQTKTDTKE